MQNALTTPPPPASPNRRGPLRQREPPMARDQHATEDIHDLDHEAEEAVAALLDRQEHGLDVVLEEHARHGALAHDVRLLRHGVLVGDDRPVLVAGVDAVDGRHHREEVLEFMEVVGRSRDGAVEGVEERWVECAEG